jgi:hypothetical protein
MTGSVIHVHEDRRVRCIGNNYFKRLIAIGRGNVEPAKSRKDHAGSLILDPMEVSGRLPLTPGY